MIDEAQTSATTLDVANSDNCRDPENLFTELLQQMRRVFTLMKAATGCCCMFNAHPRLAQLNTAAIALRELPSL